MVISELKVDVEVIRSLTQDASRQMGKLADVCSGTGLLVYGVEGSIAARWGISGRINQAIRDVDGLQQRLVSLYACIREAMERYQQMEDGLAGKARDLTERRSLLSSYPNIPGLDWSKVPDNMKQQLLDSIANAEQQKYNIPGLDWDKVPANLRDQLRASIDQAAQQRAYRPEEEPLPEPVSLTERSPAEFKAMVGGYDRENAGSNDVYYIDEHGNRTLIDFDQLQALMAEFNKAGANYHPGDILMMMPVDYTPFFQYAVEMGYDPRTFLPLNPQDRDAILGYVIGRKVFEEESRQKARAWESLALDLMPIVGSIKAVIDLSTGKDSVTGRELDGWDYAAAGAGMIAPVVAKPIAKGVSKGVKAVLGTEEAVKDGARVVEGMNPYHYITDPVEMKKHIIVPEDGFQALLERKYIEIRKLGLEDIGTVAKNAGLTEEEVLRMKKHLFLDTKKLSVGGKPYEELYFQADPEIAHAWQKAQKGELTDKEKEWFRKLANHEITEKEFMDEGMPLRDASTWNPATEVYEMNPVKNAHDKANLSAPNPREPFPGYDSSADFIKHMDDAIDY